MWPLSGDARSAVFAPLGDDVTRSDAVVRRLVSAIGLGLLADGEQLPPEPDLARSLNVSIASLRDALADLRRRGLVVTRRGRGGGSIVHADDDALAQVSTVRLEGLGPSALREQGDFHSAIAGATARLAAARASKNEIARLRDITQRLREAETSAAQRRLDTRFYVELAACSQSASLTEAEIAIQIEAGQLPWPAVGSKDRLVEVVAGHCSVIDAVEQRRGDLARSRVELGIAVHTAWMVGLALGLAFNADKGPRREAMDRRRATL